MLEVFFSYAHEDEVLRDQLEKHLSLLKRQGMISDWHDRDISAGTSWKDAIDDHLESAQLILLLVSADFLASDYCYDVEMTRALARHHSGDARVIPIILKPVDWESAPFGKLQCLPKDGIAVTLWENEDGAFVDIAKGIRKAAQEMSSHTAPISSPSRPQDTEAPLNPPDPASGQNPPTPTLEETSANPPKEKLDGNGKWRLKFNGRWFATGIAIALVLAVVAFSAPLFLGDYREHVSTGRHYFNLGKFPDARQEYQQALDLHPLYLLANTLGALVNDETGQLIKKYARSWVKNTDAYWGLEKAGVFDDADLQKIDAKLKRLEQTHPDDADIQMLRGRFYAGQAKFDKAQAHYNKAITLDAENAEAYYGLSYVYDLQGNYEAANSAALKAVKLSDSTPKYVLNLANSYVQLKNYQDALEQYASLSDDLVLPKVERARIYRLTGDLIKAKRQLTGAIANLDNPALQKLPDNQDAWYFKTDRNAILLSTLADKQYYTIASLVAVLIALNENHQAQKYTKQLEALQSVHRDELGELLEFDSRSTNTR